MRRFPEAKEGLLSKQRASIVNGRTLALKAQAIDLGTRLQARQGRGEKRRTREDLDSRGRVRSRDRCDLHRRRAARRRSASSIGCSTTTSAVPSPSATTRPNCRKSPTGAFAAQPVYELVAASGPDHAKRFTTRIRIAGRDLGHRRGRQQEAERAGRRARARWPGSSRNKRDQHEAYHRAGFVALGGRSNVGKSTLLNRMVGHKVAIVTPASADHAPREFWASAPTRDAQFLILDTPGIHDSPKVLNRRMVETARRRLGEGEVVLGVIEAAIASSTRAIAPRLTSLRSWRSARDRDQQDRSAAAREICCRCIEEFAASFPVSRSFRSAR